jgi:hypothetical protein
MGAYNIGFSKDDPLIHFIHPKVQKYNSFIQTSKISKNYFFPSVKRPTFQNVITHKIFEIL